MKVRRWHILIIIVFMLGFIYGFWIEPNNVQVENVNLTMDHLPTLSREIKFVLFSDLNFGGVGYKEKKIRDIINNQVKPDFILFAGDYFERDFGFGRNTSIADKRAGLQIQDPEVLSDGLDFFTSLKSTYGNL
ncbi:MAG: hypothetical protein GTO12_14860 [Proteobacteria bacterium]|nr:hypothetical protein [Pseudomonadota bacterium]